MDIRINSKDDVGLLTESSIRSTPYGSRPNSQRTSGLNSSRVSDLPNTIHYLSPASTAAHTICEGDFDYQDLYYLPMIHELPVTRARSTSTSSSSTSVPCEENILQRTLAIIKPEAVEFQDVVLRAVDKAGFRIVHRRNIHLTPEQVSEIYEKYYGTPAFPHMVISMSAGPIVSLSLQATNAVEKWKNLIGPMGTLREEWFFPYSVRTRFGLYRDIPNVLHASDNANEAKMENKYVYPRDILEPLPSDFQKVKDFVTVFLKPTLVLGLAEIVKTKPIDPVISLAEWLLLHNPYQPKLPEAIAVTPT